MIWSVDCRLMAIRIKKWKESEGEQSMGMKEMPQITVLSDNSRVWENDFGTFTAKVYLPKCDLPHEIINYGFMAPYLLIFGEQEYGLEEAKQFADESGLSEIAAGYASSVVFVYPTNEGGWEKASADLYVRIIDETRISQYYKDGCARVYDRFAKKFEDWYIRGGMHRSYLFGFGASADYIAKNCLKTIEGNGLYGPGDITPTVCILQNVSVMPEIQRRDIPVVSIGNSEWINEAFKEGCDNLLIKEKAEYMDAFHSFIKHQRRMVGNLDEEADLEELGLTVEPGYVTVSVSPDNCGDDKGKKEHPIGYVAYYNNGLTQKGEKLPLVLCFHGGGDSAMCMVSLAEWHLVVNKYDFLLVSIEHHMNSTATEMMTLLEHLKEKYPVDEERIYSTGFSMGGCKTWDLFQEYPEVFAAAAPMDATFEVGINVFANPAVRLNKDIILPVFYVGGEQTPLPELPFQAEKCRERMEYVLKVNRAKADYEVRFEDKDNWKNPIWGIDGDVICKARDENKNSVLTMHLFESENGCCYSAFGSASNQMHEMRHLNCENAWKYMSCFRRLSDGTIKGGKLEEIKNTLTK